MTQYKVINNIIQIIKCNIQDLNAFNYVITYDMTGIILR